jgi:hypothetical protein
MKTKEQFMSECTKRLRASGKDEEQANQYCEIAWNRVEGIEKPKHGLRRLGQKASLIRDIHNDGRSSSNYRDNDMSFTDAMILAGMVYLWLGDDSGESGSRGNYDHYNSSSVDTDSIYGSSSSDTSRSDASYSSPVITTDSDYGSYSSDYSSSSSSDYSSSSSDYSSSSSYDSGGSYSSGD